MLCKATITNSNYGSFVYIMCYTNSKCKFCVHIQLKVQCTWTILITATSDHTSEAPTTSERYTSKFNQCALYISFLLISFQLIRRSHQLHQVIAQTVNTIIFIDVHFTYLSLQILPLSHQLQVKFLEASLFSICEHRFYANLFNYSHFRCYIRKLKWWV